MSSRRPGGQRRHVRRASTKGDPVAGRRFEVTTGPIAHGGFVVARSPEDRVVFVRHALPGERVLVELTEGRTEDRFWRGDAVEVLEAAPGRVTPPCPYAGPGGCGGCDLQHADLATQRDLKTAVVREQMQRLAGLDVDVEVEPASEDETGFGWRTRMRFVDLGGGRRGLRRHRSHDVIEIEQCLVEAPDRTLPPTGTVLERVVADGEERSFRVSADGFWQAHAEAPRVLVEQVLAFAGVRPGDRVADLYAGVGLFGAFLGSWAGETGSLTSVEGDAAASNHAVANLAEVPCDATVVEADVAEWLDSDDQPSLDVVVLDPPRAGAKRRVVEGITRRQPRVIVHVACDPAALARDVALFAEQGYVLDGLRAFDLFPHSHHVECVARLVRA
ncbi:class I SAM-dependent RNA methyltransferase [Alteromonas gracilis]